MTLKFTCDFNSTFSVEWPKIKIIHNDKTINDIVCDSPQITFYIEPKKTNNVQIYYYNKRQNHTIIEDGKIKQDQSLELANIRVDDILLEKWFINDGHYRPFYFPKYIQQLRDKRINQSPPEILPSQRIWHFPGKFQLPVFGDDFFDWYFASYRDKEIDLGSHVDPNREMKFRGSLDPCTELADSLRKYI